MKAELFSFKVVLKVLNMNKNTTFVSPSRVSVNVLSGQNFSQTLTAALPQRPGDAGARRRGNRGGKPNANTGIQP